MAVAGTRGRDTITHSHDVLPLNLIMRAGGHKAAGGEGSQHKAVAGTHRRDTITHDVLPLHLIMRTGGHKAAGGEGRL